MIAADTLVRTAREILTELDPAIEYSYERLHAAIQPTLTEWRKRVENSPEKLKNFLVETDPITITAGQVDLTSVLDTYRLPTQSIRKAEILLAYGELGQVLLRTFSVDKGGSDTTVVSGEPFEMTVGDEGRRITIESHGQILVDTNVDTVSDPSNFSIDDGIVANYTGAIARIYTSIGYAFVRQMAGTWDQGGDSVTVTDTMTAGDAVAADVGRRAVVFDGDGNIIADTVVATVVDQHTFTVEDAIGIFIGGTVKLYDIEGDLPGPANLEVRFVNSRNRLIMGGRQDRFFVCAYFDGRKMYFRDPDQASESPLNTFAGSMVIRTANIPATLADVPAALVGDLASIMAEIVKIGDERKGHPGVNLGIAKGG